MIALAQGHDEVSGGRFFGLTLLAAFEGKEKSGIGEIH